MDICVVFFGSRASFDDAFGRDDSGDLAFKPSLKDTAIASSTAHTQHIRAFHDPTALTFFVASADRELQLRGQWHHSWKGVPIFVYLGDRADLSLVQNCQTWCYRNKRFLLHEIRKCLEFRVKCAQLSQDIEKLDALQRKLQVKGVDALFQHHTRGSLMRINAANEIGGTDGGQSDVHTWAWSSGNADNPVSVSGYTQLQRGDVNADVLVAYMSLTAVTSPQVVPIIPGTVYILQTTGLQRPDVAALFDRFSLLNRRDIVDWNSGDKTYDTSWSDMLQYALTQYFSPNDATTTLADDDSIEDLSNRVAATVLELQNDALSVPA